MTPSGKGETGPNRTKPDITELGEISWPSGLPRGRQPDRNENLIPDRSGAYIEKIPDWIKDLHGLKWLHIIGCAKLASMPETLSFSFESPILFLDFPNCYKLGQEARRVVTHQSFTVSLPGRNIPAEYVHRAIGNFLTIRSDFKEFRICVVVSPKQETGK